MTRIIEIRCIDPQRRDALEEAARLTLAFLSVSSQPGGQRMWKDQSLRLTLSVKALQNGCYLAKAAKSLLEALQRFGVPICKQESSSKPPSEWSAWWQGLETASPDGEPDLVLDIS